MASFIVGYLPAKKAVFASSFSSYSPYEPFANLPKPAPIKSPSSLTLSTAKAVSVTPGKALLMS